MNTQGPNVHVISMYLFPLIEKRGLKYLKRLEYCNGGDSAAYWLRGRTCLSVSPTVRYMRTLRKSMSSPVKQGQYCVFVVTKVPGTNYSLNATASISVVDCVSYRLVMF